MQNAKCKIQNVELLYCLRQFILSIGEADTFILYDAFYILHSSCGMWKEFLWKTLTKIFINKPC